MRQELLPPTPEEIKKAEILTRLGWRRCSNKYQHIVKIDRPDWADFLADKIGGSAASIMYDVEKGKYCWASVYHHYSQTSLRRSLKNTNVFRLIPHINSSFVGFVPTKGANVVNERLTNEESLRINIAFLTLRSVVAEVTVDRVNGSYLLNSVLNDFKRALLKIGKKEVQDEC